MLILNQKLFEIYVLIAFLFLCGFTLRVFKLYPGKDEPLILDFSAVVLTIGFALCGRALSGYAWRFVLIFSSSLIVLPHFIYIAREK